ncbi:MAG: hypothetical protein Q8Q63_03975 [Phaeovulum sp.]|uniref:c-type cytochrome n=1 Tax=Phaeovulum sp. TaxID=2934796 RepID=UPI002730A16B|nr:hypothetical protein [Phaeovulum sp.]MDP2064115.1 hypothetical protein [Phaeovulum sp.]MDP3860724.1 hypothetical protein [Phaeovulum sp.]
MKILPVVAALLFAATQGSAQGDVLPPDIAAGKALYEVNERGGYGCIPCHGDKAQGGRDGPKIIGQDPVNMKIQLETNDSMSFIDLTDAQFAQISAYLKYLAGM